MSPWAQKGSIKDMEKKISKISRVTNASVPTDGGYEAELAEYKKQNRQLKEQIEALEKLNQKAVRKFRQAQEIKPYQVELIQLQHYLEKSGKKMILIFEGRGGAGKGGTIRRITQYLNAKHYKIIAKGKPNAQEQSQWFFQKYIREFPHAGEIVLFDRSWYSRAIIEPIFGFCSEREYKNFLHGVVGFEKDLIRQGIILLKFYFSVSREEQARRFAQRRNDPLHRWKLHEVDLDAEDHREEFTKAKFKMLKKTHTVHSPWKIVRSDNKHLARLNTMKVILNSVNYTPLDPELDITPDSGVIVSGSNELERMEAQRLRLGDHRLYFW